MASLAPAASGDDASLSLAGAIDARLTAVRYAAEGVNLYEVSPLSGGLLPPVAPGAHIGLLLPNGVERQYSVTEAGERPERYVVGVKRDPNSRGGSVYIHDQLKVGARLRLAPPRNNFPLREDAAQTVFIAGGIGITPIWCMIQRLEALGRSWALHYACRVREEAAFLEPLQALGRTRLHFDAESGGRVFDMAAAVAAAPADAHLYCCGPTPMLTAFEAATLDRPSGHVHVEYFTPKYEQNTAGGYVVELARSKREFQIPAGMTILQVLQDAGVDVASSCEQGVCGACETRVLAGVPDHRDVVLSDDERAENKTMFICCSGSKTERLVLDL